MSNIKVPVFKPWIESGEYSAAHSALENGWLGMGSYVCEFEERIKKLLDTEDRHVVAVSTGHAAIHLSLLLMEIGAGDEVITPAFNNAADLQAIVATGAHPVFCDIDNNTLCIDLDKAQELVTERTKAIIVMDYGCMLCDHDKVSEFSKRNNLRVLHDAAHSFGSKYINKAVGSFSDITIFSFDPVKNITCIDGGAIIVKRKHDVKRLHEMRLIGMTQSADLMYKNSRAWEYDIKSLGFRYHMPNLHASIGISQLDRLNEISLSRRESCLRYTESFCNIKDILVPQTDFINITPFLYYIRVLNNRRDQLRDYLSKLGIDTGIHWQPANHFTLFQNCKKGDLSITENVYSQIISLPLHSNMKKDTVQYVIDGVNSFFDGLI